MDVLADVLARTGITGVVLSRSSARPPWGVEISNTHGAGFHLVVDGSCWLRVPGERPLRLLQGDIVLVPSGARHALSDAPDTPTRPLAEWKARPGRGTPRVQNGSRPGQRETGGGGTELVCGAYRFDRDGPNLLFSLLPPVLHFPASRVEAHEPLRATVRLLLSEIDQPEPGSSTLTERLIDALLVYAVRSWLAGQPPGAAGWLGALRDPQIGRVLGLMHGDLRRNWTVEMLARASGMSRAALARRFRRLVGEAPLAYLGHLRMDTAARVLRRTTRPLAGVAADVGYESEFAFNRAFKRHKGIAPGAYRKASARPPALERADPDRQLLRLLTRGDREIAAGKAHDLESVISEADVLLAKG